MLQQKKEIKEIDFHNKLNELQAKIEDYEVIDMEEYMKDKQFKSKCKECSREKAYNKDFCSICNNIKFKTKVSYGVFASGWIVASLASSFFLSTTSMLSIGLTCGTLANLGFKLFDYKII
jgi:hypothetical protein